MSGFSNKSAKRRVALIFGGNSSEAEVSAKSSRNVSENIDSEKFEIYEIFLKGKSWSWIKDGTEIDKSDFSLIVDEHKILFDVAFIMIHGDPGENGLLQAYFEMLEIPYTTCSSFVSALTFDKYACKTFIRDTGIKMPGEVFLRRGDTIDEDEIIEKLGLPLFVKPNDGGSSFCTSKVKSKDSLREAIYHAFEDGNTVIVEEAISGRELTNGIYRNGDNIVVLPVTEIIPDNEFFDYEAKYLGASKEICPADLPAEVTLRVQELTKMLYRYLGCKSFVRMDYFLSGDEIYFLEINTVPGMTKASLIPQQVEASGMKMRDFLTIILENSFK